MKAILMTAVGEPNVLQLADIQEPTIQAPTEILVRIKAAGLNPIDIKLRSRGTFHPDRLLSILGCDGAGIVEEIGSEVTKFKVGDQVYFCNGGLGFHQGNYAELTTIDEKFVAHKPKSLSFEEAAAAPLVLITAWEALYDRGTLQNTVQSAPTSRNVLIHAGAGGVGHVAIQLAKLRHAKVCTTVGSEAKGRFVRDLGADFAIAYKQTDFVEAAIAWTNGEGVDLGFDTVGGKLIEQTFPAVKIYGDLVTILEPPTDISWKVARTRNLRFSFELMLTPMLLGKPDLQIQQAKILSECADLFDSGKLKIHVSEVFQLADVAKAHKLLETGSMTGKIAITI
ncbi:MAG: zinc-dependent alcohol dehydrogenase family protein [Pseudanabaena sp. M135S2SP2A07QC]|nr:zinc-dependent alcohol dehydrogenase family protein [Pseudanabaena sp. M090S1SP2A07QC]MCA6506870.1 zinc-dependent alcohol dehydrogenase family protein [Pseudanabaena sp. M172S2SP2A07QC]MCA6519509.1 zinc-dependent alcohol dehydrogenase family protein [Pseudanabaena sp. M110S1SP2A07QC]MCA6524233.1 zinc-dependent alcohol dehydrogenase family protein [Pseudanabaena sp. M051S1SP2A07QC]MCA6527501.1 zinc-dependent alcohol dehydrogenase family protein [Pseudanabaena sp. M179S2SP2A07QC]MCA6530930.1 